MKFTPEPYQILMKDHLLQNDRAYSNVGLGLGKTASTLSALNELFMDGAIRAALVVAPIRVARLAWPNEIAKWDEFKWMKTEILQGKRPSGKAQIYLINYERLQQLTNLDFCDVVVFDEITKAKNPKSKRIKSIAGLMTDHRRWGLTGTPRPNSLLELFGQVRLIDGGQRLGRTFSAYRDCYFTPTDYMRYNWVPKKDSKDRIYQKISDITITLRSSDYLDVADTVLEDIEVTLPASAQEAYDELEKDFLTVTANGVVTAKNAAVLAGKLHQMCGGNLYSEDRTVVPVHDSKIEALVKLLKDLNENVLVACNYVHERDRVCEALSAAGLRPVDASKFKGDIEQAWNSGSIRTLVADPRSLGHGLNLQQGGRTVVWYSPTWSRELYDQFNARLARKGQDKEPLLYRILCSGTIDEAIVQTLRERGDDQREMADVMLNYRKLLNCP
jgi:SNF2 family DNA or RNA helicase